MLLVAKEYFHFKLSNVTNVKRANLYGIVLFPHALICMESYYLGQGEDKAHRYNLHCDKNEMVLGRAYQPPQRRPMDLARHHFGDHMTRKDDKGDQPSGGETTWTNTGATRYGRGQRKTG